MFLKPIMLAGLGAAVVPLVLHLLNKARYRTVDWGAMMFLDPSPGRLARGTRLKQALLLLLRTAIIATLAIALARPVMRAGTGAAGEEARVHAIIILDRSGSMSFVENSRTRFSQAKQALINVLSNLRRGDEASLVISGDPNDTGEVQPTSDLQSIATRVGFLQPSYGKANIASALQAVREALLREPNVTHEVYLVTDRQALSWDHVNDRFVEAWQSMRPELRSPLRFFVIPIGTDRDDNVALESIRLLGPPSVRQIPAKVELQLRNFGPIPRSDLPVTILANGDPIANASANIAPNSSTTLTLWVTFAHSGGQVLSARVSSNGLRSDDQIDTAINVLEPVRTLVITGEPRSQGVRTSADYIQLALSPHQSAGEKGIDPASVRIIGADDWWGLSPDRDDVVILTNIGQFSDDQIRQIEQFIYSGGGVIFAPGTLTDINSANEDLYREGEGFLPGSLKERSGFGVQGSAVQTASSLNLEPRTLNPILNPLFDFLHDRHDQKPLISIREWVDLDDTASDARVIATFGTGKPFLVERPYGKGRVLLFTTTLGPAWNDIASTDLFLPLLQSSVRYLAGESLPDRNLKIFEPIELSLDHAPAENSAIVALPNGQQRRAGVSQTGQRWTIRYTDTAQPGRYQLSLGSSITNFVVSAPRDEADPTPLTPPRWESLQSSLGFKTINGQRDALTAAIAAQRTGKELYLPLIACAVLLAVGELALARMWSGNDGR